MEIILGALIALAGSALIPWLRDALTARRMRAEQAKLRRHDSLVELLAKNSKLAMVLASPDWQTRSTALEERSRAAMSLLLTIDDVAARAAFSNLMNRSLPWGPGEPKTAGRKIGASMGALQDILVRWSADELSASQLLDAYEQALAKSLEDPA